MPCRAMTSERPCASQPCARDPDTASIVAAGLGLSPVGLPKAFGDCAVAVNASELNDRNVAILSGEGMVPCYLDLTAMPMTSTCAPRSSLSVPRNALAGSLQVK